MPPIRGQALIFTAAAAQIGSLLLPSPAARSVIIASYVLLGWVLLRNWDRQPARIIFLGAAMNALVIAVNGGRIPVDIELATWVGFDTTPLLDGGTYKHAAMSEVTRLGFLGDVIPVPWPVRRVISIGDIFIALGVFLFVQELMGRPIEFRTRRLSL